MYCGNCGRALAVETKYCVGCGAPVELDDKTSHWLHPIGATPQPDVAARLDSPLARAAYMILAPYGLASLEEARQAMPPDQYEVILKQIQDMAVEMVRSARTASTEPRGAFADSVGGVGSGGVSPRTSVPPQRTWALATTILGVLLGIALLWRGWDIYHAGQVIDNATALLGRLAGSQGQQVTSFLSSITGNPSDYESAGEALMIAGLVCAAAGACALNRPRASIGGFIIAAALALSTTGSGAGDIQLFGLGALVLDGLSVYVVRSGM